jgi:hypothetical protein
VDFVGENVNGVHYRGAHLGSAILRHADFTGANLMCMDLAQTVGLGEAIFHETTVFNDQRELIDAARSKVPRYLVVDPPKVNPSLFARLRNMLGSR